MQGIYSQGQKSCTFFLDFFCGPPGGGSPISQNLPVAKLVLLPQGATEKFEKKCARLTVEVWIFQNVNSRQNMAFWGSRKNKTIKNKFQISNTFSRKKYISKGLLPEKINFKRLSCRPLYIVACHLPRAPSYGGVRTWVEGFQMRGNCAMARASNLLGYRWQALAIH